MKCPLCSNEITVDATIVGPYTIYQPNIHGTEESGSINVCGRCYMLTRIVDLLEEINNGHNR